MTAPPGAPRPREMSDLSPKVRPTVRSNFSKKKCNGQVCCPAIPSLLLTARKRNPHAVGRSGYAVETLGGTFVALARA